MHLSQLFASAALALVLAACGGGSSTTSSSASPGGSAAPKAAGSGDAKAASGAGKVVDLTPLPLKITLPADEAAMTMDKTMGDKKSVGVSYDAIFAGLNVSEPADKSFDEVKKGVKGDTVMFPFKKWVEESATSAIAEVTAGDKTAYTAWAWKEIGGKPYLCQSAGMNGVKSVDDAKAVLKACDSLAAK